MISKIEKIKQSVDTFNDAEFFSFGEDKNQVIIKSLNDGSLWTINYIEQNEAIVFDTENAEKIKEGEQAVSEEAEYKETVHGLMNSLKNVFSENSEEALESVRGYIHVMPREVPTFEDEEQEDEYQFKGEFGKALKANVENFYEAKKDFASLGYLFEGEEIKRGKIFDPLLLIEALESKKEAQQGFIENLELVVAFKEKLSTIFENEEVANFVATKMDLKNPKISVPKALVLVRKNFNESFDIIEKQKEIMDAYNETFEGSDIASFLEGGGSASAGEPAPFVYNQVPGIPHFRYLKFRTGAFNEENLNTLQKELQSVMGRYSELSHDELKLINEMSMKVQYMQLTGQIDDQIIVNIIDSFNRAFKPVSDYNNSQLQLGFKSASERDTRNFNKGTSNVGGE